MIRLVGLGLLFGIVCDTEAELLHYASLEQGFTFFHPEILGSEDGILFGPVSLFNHSCVAKLQ